MRAKGILLDYGGTLVEELGYDEHAANQWLLSRARTVPTGVSLDDVLRRLEQVSRELGAKRDDRAIELSWQTLTRLSYHSLGIQFDAPLGELELGYWLACARTRPMAGAIAALEAWHERGIPMAVVSNCRFSEHVLRQELERHGLARFLSFVMVTSEYGARKPSRTLFEAAARRLSMAAQDILFVGDSLEMDMAGAKAAGMKTLWFRAGESSARTDTADHSCTSWSEILHYVDGR